MKTAFFGGTFDPVHTGHLALAREVLKQGRADRILLVPAFVPPHKDAAQVTAFGHRFAMAELAIAGEPRFACSDIEKHRSGKSYTIDTLTELAAMGTYGEILLLIGSDSLRQLHLWYHAHELVERFGLIVYPRRNEPVTETELRRHWSEAECAKLQAALMASAPEFPLSSTQIREIIKKNGVGSVSSFVTVPVAEYITSHGLYH